MNFDYRDVTRGGDVDAGKGKLYPIEISYNVTNVGPNMAHRPKVTKLVLTNHDKSCSKVYILLPMDKLWLTMPRVPHVVGFDQCAEVTNPFTRLQMQNALWDEGKKDTLNEVRL